MPNAKNPKWQFGGNALIKMPSTVLLSEDTYEIYLYPKPWENADYEYPIVALFFDVEGIVSRQKHYRCFPSKVGFWKQGYVVELTFNRGELVHDYFDKNGAFIRRDFEDYYIIPVVNTNRTLKMISTQENEVIEVLK